jgi:hypothetical protein
MYQTVSTSCTVEASHNQAMRDYQAQQAGSASTAQTAAARCNHLLGNAVALMLLPNRYYLRSYLRYVLLVYSLIWHSNLPATWQRMHIIPPAHRWYRHQP